MKRMTIFICSALLLAPDCRAGRGREAIDRRRRVHQQRPCPLVGYEVWAGIFPTR